MSLFRGGRLIICPGFQVGGHSIWGAVLGLLGFGVLLGFENLKVQSQLGPCGEAEERFAAGFKDTATTTTTTTTGTTTITATATHATTTATASETAPATPTAATTTLTNTSTTTRLARPEAPGRFTTHMSRH